MNPAARFFSGAALILLALASAGAQVKVGHFNSAMVIKQMPEAKDAQRQLDQMVDGWQKELNEMQEEWKVKFEEFDKRKLIMTEIRRGEVEKELRDLDQRIMTFRNDKFGQNGELFRKQSELMRPVQDIIFSVVKEIAQEQEYDYIFDKSGEILLMYTNDEYDITGLIFEKLKLTPPAQQQTPGVRN